MRPGQCSFSVGIDRGAEYSEIVPLSLPGENLALLHNLCDNLTSGSMICLQRMDLSITLNGCLGDSSKKLNAD